MHPRCFKLMLAPCATLELASRTCAHLYATRIVPSAMVSCGLPLNVSCVPYLESRKHGDIAEAQLLGHPKGQRSYTKAALATQQAQPNRGMTGMIAHMSVSSGWPCSSTQ